MAFFAVAASSGAGVSAAAPEEGGVLTVACGSKLLVAECSSLESESVTELSVPSTLLCAAVSLSSTYLAASTEDKTLVVWKRNGRNWTQLGTRVIPKRAMVVCFTKDEKSVLVGDKTGEVNLLSLTSWANSEDDVHLLGHFSILLDMVLSPSNSHVITCDRDEKIRISKFPNSYNIESFCLSHTEFVSSLCLCPRWPHLLLSGSGDGSVRVWEWLAGRLLHSQQVGREVGGPGGVVGETEAVTKVCCSSQDPTFVVTLLEKSNHLAVFRLSSEGALTQCSQIELQTLPWDIALDQCNHLWVCLDSDTEPVLCYQWEASKLMQLSQDNSPLLKALNKPDHFKEMRGSVKDWGQMRKNMVDNVGTYLARKEERLKARPTHTSAATSQGSTDMGTGNVLESLSEVTAEDIQQSDDTNHLNSQDTSEGSNRTTLSPASKRCKLET